MKTEFTTLIPAPEPTLYKEKGSKFFAYAFQVDSEEKAKQYLADLWKTHAQATHICYAYQIGIENPLIRINDDGEPNYSAGQPIHHQIVAHNLSNVLIAVVRYYGGTKLGVGGLITAYRQAAKETIDAGKIVTCNLMKTLRFQCEYRQLAIVNKIFHQYSHQLFKIEQNEKCNFEVAFPVKNILAITELLIQNNVFILEL